MICGCNSNSISCKSDIHMKRNFFLLIMSLLILNSYGQEKGRNITHYLFPEFSKGSVLMKNGVKEEALLNYNALTEEMIFEKKGVKLAIAQPQAVDTVYIGGRKFCLVNGKFFEMLLHSKCDLYVEHKCKLKDPGKPSGYGGSSQTAATNTYSSFFTGNQVYEMKLPESFETIPSIFYWLKKDGKLVKFVSLRQLAKIFPEKSEVVKNYIKSDDVSLDDQLSVARLIRLLQ